MLHYQALKDKYFYAIIDLRTESPVGVASYLRVFDDVGSIEVGHLSYAPVLQQTPISTEAMYLMMKRVFEDWGYRRYEWKCDSLNSPSLAAAKGLGFCFEGIFGKSLVMKKRNRDTSWLSITDDEWPAIRAALELWLATTNFDDQGHQVKRLGDFIPESARTPIVAEFS